MPSSEEKVLDVPTGGLPAGWYAKESTKHPGHVYFYEPATGKVQWHLPPPAEVRCSHILLKHTGSRNPTTRQGGNGKKIKVTRTIEEARSGIAGIIDELKASGVGSFGDIAKQRSDCSSAHKGGDLDFFSRKRMHPAFSDAAFALQVGDISAIVDSPSGIHVILRTA